MIGPHVIRCTAEAMRWARRAGIVKALVEPLQAAHPDALRVFRHYFGDRQDWSRSAEDIAGELLAALGGYRHPLLYVEIFNEVGADWLRLTEVVALLHEAGVKVAVPSWATGSYTAEMWAEARAARWAFADAISLHCYFGRMGNTIWQSLRFTQFWNGVVDLPILITECGFDDV
jgi:hypothetical protein